MLGLLAAAAAAFAPVEGSTTCSPPTPPSKEALPPRPIEPKRPLCGELCTNDVIRAYNKAVTDFNPAARTYMQATQTYATALNAYVAAAEAYAKCEIGVLQDRAPERADAAR